MTGATSPESAVCRCCGATGDVYVDGVLYCAKCALDKHFDALQGLTPPRDLAAVSCSGHDAGTDRREEPQD